jgi:hypothetical protein
MHAFESTRLVIDWETTDSKSTQRIDYESHPGAYLVRYSVHRTLKWCAEQ